MQQLRQSPKDKQKAFQLILMDIQMPIMDGYEATLAIRKMDQQTPIIALSAHVMGEQIKKCLDIGMNDHLAKPIDPERLKQVLVKWC